MLRGDGLSALFGPAPAGLDGADFDRRWVVLLKAAFLSEDEVLAHIAREARVDSDLWVVEIEDRDGRHFLGDDLMA